MRAVNLIPAAERSGNAVGAGRSQGAAYAVLGLLAGLAILAGLYGMARDKVSARQGQVASITARAQQAQAQVQRLTAYTTFIAMRENRLKAVSTLVDSRFDWAHAFHELGRVLPSNVSVSSLEGSIGSTAGSSGAPASASGASSAGQVASATPPGSVPSFTLAGCATTQAAVAVLLERLRLIDGVAEVSLQTSAKAGGAGAATGACPEGAPAYTLVMSFEPLPAAASSAVSTRVISGPAAGPAARSKGARR